MSKPRTRIARQETRHETTISLVAKGILVLLALGIWLPGSSLAQTAGEPDAPIDRIVVTAERRESTVQDTPIAISAFDEEAMELRGIGELADLHQHVPNFFYTEGGGGSPITQIAVRGVGNENVTAGGDPGVAYHVDGVYLGRPATAAVDFFDLERVEVLRGPQGTLYGRNATGGSINVVTKKPTQEFEAFVDAGYGNYDWYRVRGAVSGALIPDILSARLSFVTEAHDGYLENTASGFDDLDEEDVTAFRAQLLFTPGEDTEVLFQTQFLWDDGAVGQKRLDAHPTSIELAPGFFISPYAGAAPNSRNLRKVSVDAEDSLDLWSRQFNLKVSHLFRDIPGLGDVQLTSLTSRQEMEWEQVVDNDFSELPLSNTTWETPSDQWLQEFQLVSAGDGPFQWLGGVFWFQEDISMDFLFQDFSIFRFENGGSIETTSIAVFAEASYDFEEASGIPLTLRGGLRWTRDEKEGNDFLSLTFGPLGTPIAPADSFVIDDEWTRVTGRLIGEYRVSDELMVYASGSRGYKSGGLLVGNRVVTGSTVTANVYDPEEIWAYEIGLKGLFLEGRLQANVAAFYNDYDDLQVFLLTGVGAVIENAAEAEVKGLELELVMAPVEGLLANVTLAYLDGEYDKYDTADPTEGTGTIRDLSGNRVNRSPEWSASGGIQYVVSLDDWGTLTPRIDFYWQDEVFFRPQNLGRDRAADWNRTDVHVTWEGPESDGGQWSLQLFVKNLADNDNVMNISVGAGPFGFPEQGILHPPRTFGGIVSFRY